MITAGIENVWAMTRSKALAPEIGWIVWQWDSFGESFNDVIKQIGNLMQSPIIIGDSVDSFDCLRRIDPEAKRRMATGRDLPVAATTRRVTASNQMPSQTSLRLG